jgi:hypothetical protein
MSGEQVFFVAVAFVVLAIITVLAQFKWLPKGRAGTILVFLAGVSIILSLRFANLPPDWFSASKSAFALALSLALGAFVTRAGEERAFGFPLLFGIGLTLLVANIVEMIVSA